MAQNKKRWTTPPAARHVIRALEDAGFEAWVVGGWVRDALLGMPRHDIDVTTDATWQESARVLSTAGCAVYETGTAHGTVTAVCQGEPIEVTTYRVEGTYSDHRHPDEVRFVRDVREDLARRDFTINAMAWHPERGLLDPFGGEKDLESRVIRAVGDPQKRFEEDALRIMRAVRFALRLGFEVEQCTQAALRRQAASVSDVASERVGKELDAIVRMGKAGRALLDQPEVMCAALPELAMAYGFDQRSVYHIYDVYEHIAHVCNAVQAFTAGLAGPELQWAALLHDVAKPVTYSEDVEGHGHFFGHPLQGAQMAVDIMRRLAIPSEIVDETSALIRWHDDRIPATVRAIRRMLVNLSKACPGREIPLAYELLDLCRADAVSKCPSAAPWASALDDYTRLVRQEAHREPVLSTRQLAVNGADVMRVCGMAPGPGVGMQLEMLLNAVMAGELPNERETLLTWLSA